MGGWLADNKCLIIYFNRFSYFHMVVVMSRDTDIHYSFGSLCSHLDTKKDTLNTVHSTLDCNCKVDCK